MTLPSPSIEDLRVHAAALGLTLDDAELKAYSELMAPIIDLYRGLDAVEDDVLTPQFARGEAHRPDPKSNLLNAWAVIMDVSGAAEGPLAGKTVVLKDTISLAGASLFNGAPSLDRGFKAASDATVVTRVLEAGGRIVGKAHSEYLSGSGGSHTNGWGHVLNPHRLTRSTGGSSSGCAALVASGEVDMAIGGDQGGSIRVPASFSGIVGMKPTHGLVPYTGIVPVEPTVDHAGPMTRSVADNALLLGVLAGADGLDPRQNSPRVTDYLDGLDEGVEGMRIGVLSEGFGLPISEADVDDHVRAAAFALIGLGAIVEAVSIPMHSRGGEVFWPITAEGLVRTMCHSYGLGSLARGFYPVDLLDHLSTWRESANDMPPNVVTALLVGEHMLTRHHGRYFAKAQNELRKVTAAYDAALSRYDLLVMPTTPMKATILPACDAPKEVVVQHAFAPLSTTSIFDATGHPAISVPCAMSEGLPVGLMMVGRHHEEGTIYKAAYALEQHLSLDLRPALSR